MSLYTKSENKSIMERTCSYLTPKYFFIGLAVGIISLSIAGYKSGKIDIFTKRERFFHQITPEGLVYPTIDNLIEYVKGRAPRDKTVILVAGSSISLGVGQTGADLWTKKLQELLGEKYVVVNISFRSAYFNSIGLPVFENLQKEYKRIYLIADVTPAHLYKSPSIIQANYPYDYIYWQNISRKIWNRDINKLKEVSSLFKEAKKNNSIYPQELMIHAIIENIIYTSNFWNLVGERYFFTMYSYLLPPEYNMFSKRELVTDDESIGFKSLKERFQINEDLEVRMLHQMYMYNIYKNDGTISLTRKSRDAISEVEKLVPIKNRNDILFLVTSKASYYVHKLNAEDADLYNYSIVKTVDAFEARGFNAIPLGLNYNDEDYWDGAHFSPIGGVKMASDVFTKLKKMRNELD